MSPVHVFLLLAFWIILILGSIGTALALLRGDFDWRMIFLPMWAIITGLLTYATVDDWKRSKKST